ncbi:ROK family protein [Yinghuangia seranimata]|uniref:ROK family protein n=1 Tax=Yinghuangia seranimata TaxID=408067 RepID=UPI00248D3567|nr:ROK family protein [Yinghuangia seranimata]MDI2129671.1 ROK family protein [Yinghuangia seranimata]
MSTAHVADGRAPERAAVRSGAGSPEKQQDPFGDGDFVCGIDFGGTKTAVAVARADGEILAATRLPTSAEAGAEQAVHRALAAARELIAETESRTGGRLVGAAAVSPGIVLPDRVLLAPNVPGWGELALPALLHDGLGLDPARIGVGTDAKAAAEAEARWGALRDADPGILLSLGTGIAAALVIGGRVLGGAHGAAGEIGYNLRSRGDVGYTAGRAPLEEHASGIALVRRATQLLGRAPESGDAFGDPDPRTAELVDEVLDEIAVHVANLALAVDPQRIAVTGGLMRSADRVLPALRRRLDEAVPFPPELVAAAYPQDAALRGALALAVETAGS